MGSEKSAALSALSKPLASFWKKHGRFTLFIIGILCVRWSLAAPYKIPSGSMIPTLLIGDQLFANKIAYDLNIPFTDISIARLGEPKAGEVVLFDYPENRWDTFIKRVIAVPGDQVLIEDGFVTINGRAIPGTEEGRRLLAENDEFFYVETVDRRPHEVRRVRAELRPMKLEFTVPADSYFVMGDNRDESHDSRFWGFVPRNHLRGRAERLLFRFSLDEGFPFVFFDRSLRQI